MTPMVTKCGLSYYSSIARVLIFCSHFLGQILERDGTDIALQSLKDMWMQSLLTSLKTSASSVSSRAFTDVL